MHKVKILQKEALNHNVRRIVTERPKGLTFQPGQATTMALDEDGKRDEKRPFTFTSLPEDENLEFVIKIYPEHNGVTDELDDQQAGDTLLLDDPFGAITYQGPGTFIAGGAGVTPFISILRKAKKDGEKGNHLIFSNHEEKDGFLIAEFGSLTDKLDLVYSQDHVDGAVHGEIDSKMLDDLVTDWSGYFYVCGPPKMVDDMEEILNSKGVDENRVVYEGWTA